PAVATRHLSIVDALELREVLGAHPLGRRLAERADLLGAEPRPGLRAARDATRHLAIGDPGEQSRSQRLFTAPISISISVSISISARLGVVAMLARARIVVGASLFALALATTAASVSILALVCTCACVLGLRLGVAARGVRHRRSICPTRGAVQPSLVRSTCPPGGPARAVGPNHRWNQPRAHTVVARARPRNCPILAAPALEQSWPSR